MISYGHEKSKTKTLKSFKLSFAMDKESYSKF